jgi:hypothetical protein
MVASQALALWSIALVSSKLGRFSLGAIRRGIRRPKIRNEKRATGQCQLHAFQYRSASVGAPNAKRSWSARLGVYHGGKVSALQVAIAADRTEMWPDPWYLVGIRADG